MQDVGNPSRLDLILTPPLTSQNFDHFQTELRRGGVVGNLRSLQAVLVYLLLIWSY